MHLCGKFVISFRMPIIFQLPIYSLPSIVMQSVRLNKQFEIFFICVYAALFSGSFFFIKKSYFTVVIIFSVHKLLIASIRMMLIT